MKYRKAVRETQPSCGAWLGGVRIDHGVREGNVAASKPKRAAVFSSPLVPYRTLAALSSRREQARLAVGRASLRWILLALQDVACSLGLRSTRAPQQTLLQQHSGRHYLGRYLLLGSVWTLALLILAGPAWESDNTQRREDSGRRRRVFRSRSASAAELRKA